jgi:hypothetical protein
MLATDQPMISISLLHRLRFFRKLMGVFLREAFSAEAGAWFQ